MKYRIYNQQLINDLELSKEELVWFPDYTIIGFYKTYILIDEEQASFLKLKHPDMYLLPE